MRGHNSTLIIWLSHDGFVEFASDDNNPDFVKDFEKKFNGD